MIHHQQAFVL